jgi:inorganic pyrophosphatase
MSKDRIRRRKRRMITATVNNNKKKKKDGEEPCTLLSYWHDIPASSPAAAEQDYHNFVCEIPKGTRAKMEVSMTMDMNPIVQDTTADGSLRYYAEAIPWNYGMMPRTWEDPEHAWDHLPSLRGRLGDGDPLDIVEIGSRKAICGRVYEVKVLGAFAMIDEGEVDWKVVAVARDDVDAGELHDIADVDRVHPGLLGRIHDWFRDYKIPDGKPANTFGFEGRPLARRETLELVIAETRRAYDGAYAVKSGQKIGLR